MEQVDNMRIVVTGAAGYIGSNVCVQLLDRGYEVIGVDRNLKALYALPAEVIKYGYDVCSPMINEPMFRAGKVDACIHLAADISVPESMTTPMKYYHNNVFGSMNTIQACMRHGVDKFLFSSTAAVYGNGNGIPLKETDKTSPINPYGKSKLMVEVMINDAMMSGTIKMCSLRYFNVVGNDPQQRVVDRSWKTKSNLFPSCMRTILGISGPLSVYGKDYSTADGTALRDYIHVSDLAKAHIDALESDLTGTFNVGIGQTYSVSQVIEEFRLQGHALPYEFHDRRDGDPEQLCSDSSSLKHRTSWLPQYRLSDMVRHYTNMIERINEQATQ
jgi:UDP-glucose 4-epimerase